MRIVPVVCALAVAAFAPLPVSAQGTSDRGYELPGTDAPTGSRIRRSWLAPSELPLDKTYRELTPAQQRTLKEQYESMPEADEPPYPLDGLRSIYAALASLAMRLQVEGELEMHVDVDDKGVAKSVSVLRSPDKDLTRHAATVLMLEKYKPALCGGRPCGMQFPVRVTLRRPTDVQVHQPFERMPR